MRHLTENLRRVTKGTGVSRVWQGQLIIGLALEDESSWPEVKERVRDCFGVAKFFLAYEFPQDLELIKQALPPMQETHEFRSFRIVTTAPTSAFR